MKKLFLISMLFVMILVFFIKISPAFAGEPVALVSNLQGKAKVQRAGKTTTENLEMLSELYTNDQVTIEKNSTIKITFYHDTHAEVVKGFFKATVLQDKLKPLKGKPKAVRVLTAYKGVKTMRSIKASSEKFGGTTARNWKKYGIAFYSPRRTVANSKPDFDFKINEKYPQKKVLLVLTGRDAKDVIFKQYCSDNECKFPSDKPALKRGKIYRWNLVVFNDKGKPYATVPEEEMQPFRVLDSENSQKLITFKEEVIKDLSKDPSDLSPLVVYMTYCMDKNLLEEAFDTCKILLKKKPTDKKVRNLFKKLCSLREMSPEDTNKLLSKLTGK